MTNQDTTQTAFKPSLLWLLAGTAAVVLLVVLLGAWVAGDNPTPAIDLALTQSVQSYRSEPLTAVMAAISRFGWSPWSWLLTVLASVLVIWRVDRRIGVLLGMAVLLQFLVNLLIKEIVMRPRPVDPPVWVYRDELSYSFPSGHVMEYVMLFGLLMWLAYRCMRPGALRTLTLVGMGLLIGLVGVSRIYLGAHWLTDVVGAYLAGAACLAWAMWVISEHYGFAAQGR